MLQERAYLGKEDGNRDYVGRTKFYGAQPKTLIILSDDGLAAVCSRPALVESYRLLARRLQLQACLSALLV